jgi:hypothetical protein
MFASSAIKDEAKAVLAQGIEHTKKTIERHKAPWRPPGDGAARAETMEKGCPGREVLDEAKNEP